MGGRLSPARRSRGAPPALARALAAEHAAHRDVLGVDVAWNESRVHGPVFSLAAWLRHATLTMPAVRFIAKVCIVCIIVCIVWIVCIACIVYSMLVCSMYSTY